MAGFERFAEVLHLFDERKSNWTIQDIANAIEVPASTVYRTVRDLLAHRFLEASAESHYRLGPAFVEFDRRVRLTDPLIEPSHAFIQELVEAARVPCVAVMARLYGTQVICVASLQAEGAHIPTGYERGRPMPLLRGATSKAVLAMLPGRALKKVLSSAPETMAALEIERLRHDLASIRKLGFCVTRGEVDEGLAGIAVPLARPDLAIVASASLIMDGNDLNDALERRLTMLLVASGAIFTRQLTIKHVT